MNSGRIALSMILILVLSIMLLAKTTTMPSGYAASNSNQTATASVTVNGWVSITLYNQPITFGSMDQGTNNSPATNNNFTIQIDPTTNIGVMVYVNASNFTMASGNFNPGNMTYNVTGSGTGAVNTSCTGNNRCAWSLFPSWVFNDTAVSLPKNNTVGDYISIPVGQTQGAYGSNLRVCAQQTQATNDCK
jgi:hypothetical protein